MVTAYGPIWLVIFSTFTIYVTVGKVVLKWHRELLNFSHSASSATESRPRGKTPGITRTTEVFITSEPIQLAENTQHQHGRDDQSQMSPRPKSHSQFRSKPPRSTSGTTEANSAAVKYCKCAMLFFVALLVTWVPSTINRILTIVHPSKSLFGLNYAAGMVLPLQGFWNAIIYIATSSAACRALMRRVVATFSRCFTVQWVWKRQQRGRLTTPVDLRGSTGRRSRRVEVEDSASMQELRTTTNETM
jgi:hypothetical protein